MTRNLTLFFILVFPLITFAQNGYWQQRAEYEMTIDMDVEKHQYAGVQELVYYNNSPDTITEVYYHLYFNAFQPGSMMDVRNLDIEDPSPRIKDRISKLSDDQIGYIKVNKLTQDGKALAYEEVGTILEVKLNKGILPGGKSTFDMTWDAQIPIQIRRSGRDNKEGVDYSMSQWYPKMCEYDYLGWHANPYIGREFYGIWGDFDVTINMDEAYTIGGTGILQNPKNIGKGYAKGKGKAKNGKLSWNFVAKNVHDFVWAADTDYIHDKLDTGRGYTLHFFYLNEEEYHENWKALQSKTDEIFAYAEKHFGKYPYKQYSVMQGGDGGMEYPMATLITGRRKLPSLIGVTAHEAMHSWYQMLLGTNESLYAWMDEGFTSYSSARIMASIFNKNEESGEVHKNAIRGYINLATSGDEEPLTTHADHYNLNYAHSSAVYNKGEVFVTQLGYIIGEEALSKSLLRYYDEWKFKHPTPNDFLRIAEKEGNMELDWYMDYFVNSTKQIDYGITEITGDSKNTNITISKIGLMIMPIEVEITLNSGNKELHYIPLRIMRGEKKPEYNGKVIVDGDWPWTYPNYQLSVPYALSEIASVEIDPSNRLADVDQQNNYITVNNEPVFFWKSKR